MESLPSELVHRIFFYINEIPDLCRGSVVCRRWRPLLMGNEHFLNKWFHRSLQYSQQSGENNRGGRKRRMIDQSQFPSNLQSSDCHFLPLIDPFALSNPQDYFERKYPVSLFHGFHSFSFWFFFSPECELVVRIGYHYVLDLHSCLDAGHTPSSINGKQTLLADQWIHLVFANTDSSGTYRIWINGDDSTKFNLDRTYNHHLMENASADTIALSCMLHTYSIQSQIEARLADLVAFKRRLSPIEIRAIYQQQTSIDRVQIGTYVTNKSRSAHVDALSAWNRLLS